MPTTVASPHSATSSALAGVPYAAPSALQHCCAAPRTPCARSSAALSRPHCAALASFCLALLAAFNIREPCEATGTSLRSFAAAISLAQHFFCCIWLA